MPIYNLPLPTKIISTSKKKTNFRMLSVQFGDGYSQQVLDGINAKIDSWDLAYAPLSFIDKDTVESFFDTVNTTQWFYWTPIGETVAKKWLLKNNSIKYKYISNSKLEIHFSIYQTFNL